jgi:signal transduction histidine kinase
MGVLFALWKIFLILFVNNSPDDKDAIFMLRSHINFTYVKYTIWIIILIIYLHVFMYKKIKYFVEVDQFMNDITTGNLDKKIPENENHLLGKLAKNMNTIIEKLNKSMEEERLAEQTKYDLITNVSHDLRTPLTSILGYLDLVDKDYYKDEIQLRYYVNIAYEKSKRLNVLINDLFEYTITKNSTLILKKEEVNLIELLNQLYLEFRIQFKNLNMECRTFFSEDKLFINGDAIKLARAFENLINNGIRYGKQSKYIDIVTRKENSIGIIEIINYGEPIPAVDLPFIFDRFYRAEKSRSTSTGGSGLGLAITKNIINLHKGEISIESNYEKTTFIIKLPLINNSSLYYCNKL